MRRFYVVPRSLMFEYVKGRDYKYHDLFMSVRGGAHYVELDGAHILLCCGDFGRDDHEATLHAHPEVARLHHGESPEPLEKLFHESNAHKKFGLNHAEALEKIGIKGHHTVQDVSDIASKIHPLVSLGEKY